jgi:hypothetical protein
MRRRRRERGHLHSRKADAAPSVGGAQARWAGKGREEAQRGRRGAGQWQVTRAGQKKEGGRAKMVAQAEIQGSKRKSILIDFWIKIGLEIE